MSEEVNVQQQQSDGEDFLPGFSSVSEFSNDGIKRILAATKAFQSLPSAGPAWDLQKSYPKFNKAMKNARNKLVPMISSLLKHANIPVDEFRNGDMDEKFDFVVESNDDMLERIGRALDEASGLYKKAEAIVVNQTTASSSLRPPGTWGKRKALDEQGPHPPNADSKEEDQAMPKLSNRQIKSAIYKRSVKEKPQVKFKTPVDNSISPFVPKLKEKPNSIKPLSILPEYNDKNEEFYGHPYLVELNRWEPLDEMLTKVTPQPPRPLEETPLVEISTARDVERLLRDLYPVKEISIDLEHHSYRSFLGFTCLMQISTREKDYIIDTLALREHMYHLNEIFTNPKVVKVFHGSTSDIEWLQKDFGLYIVNMFDTQVAAKLLGHQQLSLQSLLDRYCGVSQNKTFQLADWRIRPLLKEMIHYARQDTHSLLYIYDLMKNELIEAGKEHNELLMSVYDQSKVLCLKRYEKPGNNPKLALRKMRRSLNNRQVYAFMELYKWRDLLAREKDESIAYVLPNHMMLMISEQLPKEMTGILACCDPVPPFVHTSLGIIHKIVTTARNLPLQENTSEEKSEKRQKLKDWVVLMNSVHDVTLKDITKNTEEKQDMEKESTDDAEEKDSGKSTSGNNLSSIKIWPQPLREPSDLSQIHMLEKPSIFFNCKIKTGNNKKNMSSSSKISVKSEISSYNFEAAATPFERYLLSKEIMDIMKDPKKKEALDMENPVVKAVYETVFCDPAEQEGFHDGDEKPQQLEKVFTDGEFIPFNPMGDGANAKSKKRKRKEHEWNDVNQQDHHTVAKNKKSELAIPFDMDDDDTINLEPDSNGLGEFMAVSNNVDKSKNQKKKKKGKNILKKLKNPFHKKKSNEQEEDTITIQEIDSRKNSVTSKKSTDSPVFKRRKYENPQQNKNDSPNSSSNFNNNKNRNNPSTRRQPNQPQQGQSPNRGRKGNRSQSNRGGKLFDFRSRGGGKSMTFK